MGQDPSAPDGLEQSAGWPTVPVGGTGIAPRSGRTGAGAGPPPTGPPPSAAPPPSGWPAQPAPGQRPAGGWPAAAYEEPIHLTPPRKATISSGAAVALVALLTVVVLIIVSLKLFAGSDAGQVHQLKVFEDPEATPTTLDLNPVTPPPGFRSTDLGSSGTISFLLPSTWKDVPKGAVAVDALAEETLKDPTRKGVALWLASEAGRIRREGENTAAAFDPSPSTDLRIPNLWLEAGGLDPMPIPRLEQTTTANYRREGWVLDARRDAMAGPLPVVRLSFSKPGSPKLHTEVELQKRNADSWLLLSVQGVADAKTVDTIMESLRNY